MIEALAHDLGKVTPARFDDHAAASVELLRRAGFVDDAVLNLIERHHKPSRGDDPNLQLLQMADRLAASQRADGGSSAAFIPDCEAFFGKAFFRKVLDYNYLRLTEAYLVHELNEHRLKFGDDNMSLAPKHSFREASYKPVFDEKIGNAIVEMHSAGSAVTASNPISLYKYHFHRKSL